MGPLLLPVAVMLSLSAALAAAGARLGRRLPRGAATLACSVPVAVMLLHGLYLGDRVTLARLVPSADVIVWGNAQPLAAGLLAGLAWATLRTPRWQRVLLVTVVAVLAVYRAYGPLAGRPPAIAGNTWFGDVCKQSTLSTCSAAAAATALRSVGIDATEAEMATLCLTRPAGTLNLGLYRGLRMKTAGTPYVVEPFAGSLDDLLGLGGPAVCSVASSFRDRSGMLPWPGGARHSVVLVGRYPDGALDIADPYTGGHQHQSVDAFRSEWDGQALRLTRRSRG